MRRAVGSGLGSLRRAVLAVRVLDKIVRCVCLSAERAVALQNDRKHFMELLELEFAREIHPVDVIEQVAHNNDWAFERAGDDEISISVAGSWTDYHVSFSWMEDFEALHLACAFDIKVPEARALEVMRLLSLINEQLLFGHFDLWEQEGAIMFRQSLLLAGGVEPSSQQVEVLLSSRAGSLRMLFSGVPVRRLVGNLGQGCAGRRPVRDVRKRLSPR